MQEAFLLILKDHTAGDPQKDLIWTDLSQQEIQEKLKNQGYEIGRRVVKQLLYMNHFKKRKIQKRKTVKQVANRNEQFEKIAQLKREYAGSPNPMISIDAKKKENLGDLWRPGSTFTKVEITSLDHDFKKLSTGTAIPHGIYDLKRNVAHIHIGTSHETSEFAYDSLKKWWWDYGKEAYPQASSILMLMDGGGSNSSRRHVFKEALQKLATEIGLEIRVAHYPPYASKWNPIEHRVFPHVTRSMQGIILRNHKMVKELIEKTKTQTGLKVFASIIDKVYELGKKVAKDFKESLKIKFDDVLGQWNYTVYP